MGIDLDAAEDVTSLGIPCRCRPKWKRRPAADADTGDARGPSSYDRGRFTGKLSQPNRKWRSGQCTERSNCDSQPIRRFPPFEVTHFGEKPQSCVASRPGERCSRVRDGMAQQATLCSISRLRGRCSRSRSLRENSIDPVYATRVIRDNPTRFLRQETLESQTTRPFFTRINHVTRGFRPNFTAAV